MIDQISQDFIRFHEQWKQYCNDSSTLDYRPDRFKWYRPTKENLSYTEPSELASPYETDELEKDNIQYIEESISEGAAIDEDGNPRANRGDAAVLSTQNDLIHSATRAFNERYSGKLRHFSHADGVLNRIADKEGVLQAIHHQLLSIIENAKQPRSAP